MEILRFAQHTHLGLMFETQSSLWINTWYSWVILLTIECAVHVDLIHHVNGKLSWSSLVIIYRCTKLSEYSNHSFTYSPIYSQPPWYILLTNFWNIIQLLTIFQIIQKHYLQCKEMPKAVTKITFRHKVNFSLQNKTVFFNDNI